jgi:acetylglutamate kinase
MIPKAASCVNAIKGGVKKSHILDAGIPHALLLEIFTDKGIGTEIVR